VWVLDPIDGTKNFAARIQVWATLIALMVDGEPVLGVASAPALGERYAGARGRGATLNGRPIHVSAVDSLSDALLCSTGIHSFAGTSWERAYLELTADVYRTRGFGDFWGHVLVARGSADAMVEIALRTWDWAAVKVIVEEAGGRVTQIDGSPVADHSSVLATNGLLHGEVLARFAADVTP
jgi:histidinol-phosphatase